MTDERFSDCHPSTSLPERPDGKTFRYVGHQRAVGLHWNGKAREIVRFGFGQSPFPVPAPVVASLRASAPCKDYLEVRGLAARLRSAVAEYHRRTNGLDVAADDACSSALARRN